MDYIKLSNDMTDAVSEALHYFDSMTVLEQKETASERYLKDPIFRMKVRMLVSQLTIIVQSNLPTK